MATLESITVLSGGVGSERDVSIASGQAIAEALAPHFTVNLLLLDEEKLPDTIDPSRTVLFPALHGGFGEDGSLQALCAEKGIFFCGSDSAASRLCIDKNQSKQLAKRLEITSPMGICFDGKEVPLADEIISELGTSLVIKPSDEGSSVGLHFTEHRSQLGVALSQIHRGSWLVEQRIRGRELTIGVLNGQPLGVVEIVSASGVYDYSAKYTSGTTEYIYPAELDHAVERQLMHDASALFHAAGCRDFARIDFLLDKDGLKFLEVNTLPGLTSSSLLPKSASCHGLNFDQLAQMLVQPAIERFHNHYSGASAQ